MLKDFLEKADVPETRKDLTKIENVLWLSRNLGIRNSHIEGYKEAAAEIKQIILDTDFRK